MEETENAFNQVESAAIEAADATVGKFAQSAIDFFKKTFTLNNLFKIIGILLVLALIWLVFQIIKRTLKKFLSERLDKHQKAMTLRILNYAYFLVSVLYVLSACGIKLKALWGAAGIAGVAVGFAAQTTISNFISGLFIISERTMKIGDFISCSGVSGTVESVGLLSIKIKNSDGQLVRIPNSQIINTNFQNNNFYSTRRMSFQLSVSYNADLRKAVEVLKSVPQKCPTVLTNPEPTVWYESLGESGINMTLALWFETKDLVQTKNDVFINIIEEFKKNALEIPFNKIDVNLIPEKK